MEPQLVASGFSQIISHPSTKWVCVCYTSWISCHMLPVSPIGLDPLGEIQVGMWLVLLVCHSTRDELQISSGCHTKAHMPTGILQGAAVPESFVAGVSLLSILQEGYWATVSTPARHCFSTYTCYLH